MSLWPHWLTALSQARPRRIGLATLLWILFVSIFTEVPAHAADDDAGAWVTFTSTDVIGAAGERSRWHYWFDAQARYFDLGSGINQYVVRPGIGYGLGDNVTVWAGYARLRARNRSGAVADENRYWQQLSWTARRWDRGTLTMRARLEQRSLSTGDDLGFVFRFLTKYVRPIGQTGKTNLVLGLEPFVDLKDTDWGGESGLGQNRTFAGIGWRINKAFSVEAGYMNQFIWVDGAEDRSNHLGVLNFRMSL